MENTENDSRECFAGVNGQRRIECPHQHNLWQRNKQQDFLKIVQRDGT